MEKLSIQDDILTYTTNDGAAHEFDALEFLAQLSCHIPKTYESITRYYGRYSCRRRGERAKIAPAAEEQESNYRRDFSELGSTELAEVRPSRARVEGRCKLQMSKTSPKAKRRRAIKDIMKAQGLGVSYSRPELESRAAERYTGLPSSSCYP